MQASQRARINVALFDAVAKKGYASTTIGDVVQRAGVSRRTFYEHYTGKEACFLAAFDDSVATVGSEMLTGLAAIPKENWRERVRLSWRYFLASLVAHPTSSWVLYIETLRAGSPFVERTTAINDGFAETFHKVYRLARKEDPSLPELSRETFSLYIGGTAERIRNCLHTRGAAALPELEDLFVETMLVLCGDRSPHRTSKAG